jgi:hypothetical protein
MTAFSVTPRAPYRAAVIAGAALLAAALTLIQASSAQPPAPTPHPTMPIKQLMETTITEASGTFNDAMLHASEAALAAAARTKDHDALLKAGDLRYAPCEGCHLQFNPGVANPN